MNHVGASRSAEELLEPSVKVFAEFMKFIARHDLWDEIEKELAEEGITKIIMARRPIDIVRQSVMNNVRMLHSEEEREKSPMVACGCPAPQTPTTPPPWTWPDDHPM
jgi:hypothetical protein